MKRHAFILLGAISLSFIGCAKNHPLLENHPNYIGEWKTENNTLKIEKDGDAKFIQHIKAESKTANSDTKSTSISDVKAPLSALDDQHIEIGEGNFAQRFKVDKAPFQKDGHWVMVLDGQTYTRK